MDLKDSVESQFGAAAEHYAESWPHRDGPDLQALIEAAGLRGDESVLDVGTGAGHTAFAFAAQTARVEALDLTAAMLDEVREGSDRRGLSNIETRLGDAEALPYPDATFDVVTTRLSAHHYPFCARAVAEMARVLRPGGLLLVSDTVSPEDATQDTYLNAIEVLRDPSHVRNHRVSEWSAMMTAAGLVEPQELGRFPCPLEFDIWTQRMATPPAAVQGLLALFAAAPREVREQFSIDVEGRSWCLEIAALRARKPSGAGEG